MKRYSGAAHYYNASQQIFFWNNDATEDPLVVIMLVQGKRPVPPVP